MREINRCLMVVKPKQPFLDWINSIEDENELHELEELREEASAYLIPEFETLMDRTEILVWCADFVFEQELWSWCTDEDLWPLQRDAETFLSWFDSEFHTMVFDLDDQSPLEYVNFDSDPDEPMIDPDSNGH